MHGSLQAEVPLLGSVHGPLVKNHGNLAYWWWGQVPSTWLYIGFPPPMWLEKWPDCFDGQPNCMVWWCPNYLRVWGRGQRRLFICVQWLHNRTHTLPLQGAEVKYICCIGCKYGSKPRSSVHWTSPGGDSRNARSWKIVARDDFT